MESVDIFSGCGVSDFAREQASKRRALFVSRRARPAASPEDELARRGENPAGQEPDRNLPAQLARFENICSIRRGRLLRTGCR